MDRQTDRLTDTSFAQCPHFDYGVHNYDDVYR